MAAKKKSAADKVREEHLKRKEAAAARARWDSVPTPAISAHSSTWEDSPKSLLIALARAVYTRENPEMWCFVGESTLVTNKRTGTQYLDEKVAASIMPLVLRYFGTAIQRVALLERDAKGRPMAGAPRDGRPILIADPQKNRPVIARYLGADEASPTARWVLDADFFEDFVPLDTWLWWDLPSAALEVSNAQEEG